MNVIKKILMEQGRTQSWLIRELSNKYSIDVPRSTMSNYCANRYQPDIITFKLISEVLDVMMETLIPNIVPNKVESEDILLTK